MRRLSFPEILLQVETAPGFSSTPVPLGPQLPSFSHSTRFPDFLVCILYFSPCTFHAQPRLGTFYFRLWRPSSDPLLRYRPGRMSVSTISGGPRLRVSGAEPVYQYPPKLPPPDRLPEGPTDSIIGRLNDQPLSSRTRS